MSLILYELSVKIAQTHAYHTIVNVMRCSFYMWTTNQTWISIAKIGEHLKSAHIQTHVIRGIVMHSALTWSGEHTYSMHGVTRMTHPYLCIRSVSQVVFQFVYQCNKKEEDFHSIKCFLNNFQRCHALFIWHSKHEALLHWNELTAEPLGPTIIFYTDTIYSFENFKRKENYQRFSFREINNILS